ncbi:hypothetical protein MXD63_29725 [Frankia sp. Cpl3]|uniref:hypothetical protein n=1 Tax=Parafrankia colletiae TaxID=573497 RepID=UPI0009FC6D83|nr:hypothetical protein [Parafrankia colletiae]MCK9904214.1 hypothetical protein [Frankia sp. Cpl3]
MARIRDGEDDAGLLLVRPTLWSQRAGGALWWRRWSDPRHAATLDLYLPSSGLPFTDSVVAPDDLPEELDDWDAGRFRFVGEIFTLHWLDENESRRLATEQFGVDRPT